MRVALAPARAITTRWLSWTGAPLVSQVFQPSRAPGAFPIARCALPTPQCGHLVALQMQRDVPVERIAHVVADPVRELARGSRRPAESAGSRHSRAARSRCGTCAGSPTPACRRRVDTPSRAPPSRVCVIGRQRDPVAAPRLDSTRSRRKTREDQPQSARMARRRREHAREVQLGGIGHGVALAQRRRAEPEQAADVRREAVVVADGRRSRPAAHRAHAR